MKGYQCDRCGKFFIDNAHDRIREEKKTRDENGNPTTHLYGTPLDDDVDLCGDCTKELCVWLGKETLVQWVGTEAVHKRLKKMDPAWKPLK